MKILKFVFLIMLGVFSFFYIGCNEEEDEEPEDVVYTVTFNSNGGSSVASQNIKEGEKVSKPENPSKEKSEFVGWFNGDNEYDFNLVVTSNLELTAKWVNLYTVTFKVNGEVVKEEVVKEGEDADFPDAPSVTGKNFVGWEGTFENVTADSIVNAVFTDIICTVTFKVDGVNYGETLEVIYGEAYSLPIDNPTKEGFNFIGWDSEVENVTTNLIVNALFEPIEYNIKYYDGENELTDMSPVTYTIIDNLELSIYNKENTSFNGWYISSDFTGEGLFSITEGNTGDLVLYALNINGDANGGISWWDTTSYEVGSDAKKGIDAISDLPEIFEQDFYTYLKDNNLLSSTKVAETKRVDSWEKFSAEMTDPKRIWNDTSTGGTAAANGYVSLFLYTTITLNEDKSVKDVSGGFLGTEPYKSKYLGLLDLLCIMTSYKVEKSNYPVLSSNSNASRAGMGFVIDGYFYGTQGVASSYFANARNIIPAFNTRYSVDGEVVVATLSESTKLVIPSRLGYVFNGWYLDSECTKKLGEVPLSTENTLFASWKKVE